MTRRVESVAVVGRDAAAWLTALTLRRALGRTGLTVSVVELPSLLTPADAFAAVPALASLHALVGLDDAEVFEATQGAPTLGQRFSNWSPARPPFIHGYDTQRPAIADIDFLQYWVKARSEGLRVEFNDFSLAASAARHGRTAFDGVGPIAAPVTYGFHLDARRYADLVKARALAAGVSARAGEVASVDRIGDVIRQVRLTDGAEVRADLFIDASGAEAALAGGAFESWRDLFAADRLMTTSTGPLRPMPAFSEIAAFSAGWTGLYPLRDRTAVTAVYSSAAMSDAEVLASLPALIGRPLAGEATVEALSPGIRPAWTGNCIAIGEAAAVLEPLDGIRLHLIHLGLSQLIALFPATAETMPEAAAYNRSFASHVRNVRDFQLTHYLLNQRLDEPLWDRARGVRPPDALAARLRRFAARGVLNLYDDESFQEQNWSAIVVGHGLIPRAWDPLIEAVPVEEQMGKTRGLLSRIAEEVNAMPGLEGMVQ